MRLIGSGGGTTAGAVIVIDGSDATVVLLLFSLLALMRLLALKLSLLLPIVDIGGVVVLLNVLVWPQKKEN